MLNFTLIFKMGRWSEGCGVDIQSRPIETKPRVESDNAYCRLAPNLIPCSWWQCRVCFWKSNTFHFTCKFETNNYLFRQLNSTLDGINLWSALSDDMKSDRNEILHNIDDIYGSASLTMGEWKVHKGTNYKGQRLDKFVDFLSIVCAKEKNDASLSVRYVQTHHTEFF